MKALANIEMQAPEIQSLGGTAYAVKKFEAGRCDAKTCSDKCRPALYQSRYRRMPTALDWTVYGKVPTCRRGVFAIPSSDVVA